MKNTIHPCIWFDGQAQEAARFYCGIFNNARITADTPMVVNFEIGGKKFMGLNGGPMFKVNPSISFFVKCESLAQTNAVWDKLSEGGKALMDIGTYPWSERYGWIQDKFGVSWQVMLHYQEGTPQSVSPAMLFTHAQLGRAEEAIKCYTALFPDSASVRLERYPTEDKVHAGMLMYSEFSLASCDFIAMDGPGGHDFIFNEAISFVVECDTQDEIDQYWNALTEGGAESMCGWLKDRFGVSWQIIPRVLGKLVSDPERGARVMQALMKMKKLDLHQLENA